MPPDKCIHPKLTTELTTPKFVTDKGIHPVMVAKTNNGHNLIAFRETSPCQDRIPGNASRVAAMVISNASAGLLRPMHIPAHIKIKADPNKTIAHVNSD